MCVSKKLSLSEKIKRFELLSCIKVEGFVDLDFDGCILLLRSGKIGHRKWVDSTLI